MTPGDDSHSALSLDAGDFDGEGVGPPPDELFKALANEKRRRLLAILTEESTASLDDLTDVLVGWEATDSGPAGPDEWAKMKIELVHAHVPLLADTGLVDYDESTDEVRLASLSDPVCDLLRFATEYERAVETGQAPTPDS
ncbi:hypothetical protein EGH21_07370 [Halomicroarcula sp. F13]|uniref:DUF7344 domain-containing protein n=1 Tax=Haloarcula rubra TaxID=2487747 RepID=A0AAW4PP27_9EURY|nr:hypothetical protein [Halomicroarcula rubra]MBX0322849.1 hypothetical protein [Halomicroarcula rubra]